MFYELECITMYFQISPINTLKFGALQDVKQTINYITTNV